MSGNLLSLITGRCSTVPVGTLTAINLPCLPVGLLTSQILLCFVLLLFLVLGQSITSLWWQIHNSVTGARNETELWLCLWRTMYVCMSVCNNYVCIHQMAYILYCVDFLLMSAFIVPTYCQLLYAYFLYLYCILIVFNNSVLDFFISFQNFWFLQHPRYVIFTNTSLIQKPLVETPVFLCLCFTVVRNIVCGCKLSKRALELWYFQRFY